MPSDSHATSPVASALDTPQVAGDGSLEVSIVIPCLNEADTIAGCVDVAVSTLRAHALVGEVVVADNGSHDGSPGIAAAHGARVVHVASKGYGHALTGGINAARGRLVVIGDADGQHDFTLIPAFVEKVRQGFDMVQGCRLPSGGGRVLPGAMSWSHRWIGNPMFSLLARWWFGATVHDVYCGMRAFKKDLFERLDLRCTGMEFAIEMIVKASLHRASIAELPITVHPDGRTAHTGHMRTFRDGWRTLRFFLMYSPRWVFLVPGLLLGLGGAIGYGLVLSGRSLGGVRSEVNILLLASLALLVGYQALLFALFSKTFAVNEGLMPKDPRLDRFFEIVNLEKGLLLGAAGVLVGLTLLVAPFGEWPIGAGDLGGYDPTIRWTIPGATLTALSVQTILSGFLISMLGLKRR